MNKLESHKGFDATASPFELGWDQVQTVAKILGIPRYEGNGKGISEYRKLVVEAKEKLINRGLI